MNWNAKDIEMFLKEKEYIDTAVIVLMPVTFDTNMKRAAEQGEFINLFSMHVEKQFKGRVVILPSFTYVNTPEDEVERLESWIEKALNGGFSHVFCLTSDNRWQAISEKLERLYFIPSIPLEHLEEQYKHSVMEEQLKTFIPKLIKGWQ